MSKNYDASRIIARYKEVPVSIGQIAAEFNLCSVTVSRILKAANVDLWSRQDLNRGDLKVDYFQEINTEIKAYLLGLFTADGCIYATNANKFFTIQLKSEDSYMIDFIKDELNAPRKIVKDSFQISRKILWLSDALLRCITCSFKAYCTTP